MVEHDRVGHGVRSEVDRRSRHIVRRDGVVATTRAVDVDGIDCIRDATGRVSTGVVPSMVMLLSLTLPPVPRLMTSPLVALLPPPKLPTVTVLPSSGALLSMLMVLSMPWPTVTWLSPAAVAEYTLAVCWARVIGWVAVFPTADVVVEIADVDIVTVGISEVEVVPGSLVGVEVMAFVTPES